MLLVDGSTVYLLTSSVGLLHMIKESRNPFYGNTKDPNMKFVMPDYPQQCYDGINYFKTKTSLSTKTVF
jgi:hypothetical protein